MVQLDRKVSFTELTILRFEIGFFGFVEIVIVASRNFSQPMMTLVSTSGRLWSLA